MGELSYEMLGEKVCVSSPQEFNAKILVGQCGYLGRSSLLRILPTVDLGSSSKTVTFFGIL